MKYVSGFIWKLGINFAVDWRNLMKQLVIVGAQLLWGGRYGCNNGCYGCTIVMSYIEINKAVSQWLLTFNLCVVSVTWPLSCAFHIPCIHTPEIIDMHRGVCDNCVNQFLRILYMYMIIIHILQHHRCQAPIGVLWSKTNELQFESAPNGINHQARNILDRLII